MLWFDRAGLDSADYSALQEHIGRPRPRVLAWAPTATGVVVGLPERFAIRDGATWHDVAWKDIVHGGWDPLTDSLTWTLADGHRDSLTLADPGRLPELFRERVTATIVYTEKVKLRGSAGATLSARRDPAAPLSEIAWQVVPDPGIDVADPQFRDRIDAELQRIKAEYAIS